MEKDLLSLLKVEVSHSKPFTNSKTTTKSKLERKRKAPSLISVVFTTPHAFLHVVLKSRT